MDWQIQLISLYLILCNYWNKEICVHAVRLGSNQGQSFITDEEIATIYIFGVMQGHSEIKSIYQYTCDYLKDWFSYLPSYEGFCYRLNRINNCFPKIVEHIISTPGIINLDRNLIIDSLPIVLAGPKRSEKAKVAPQLANKGFCGSKDTYYYGVKLHVVGSLELGSIPKPILFEVTPASNHDLTAFKDFSSYFHNFNIFGDKAYGDSVFKKDLKENQNVNLFTPVKKNKNSDYQPISDQVKSTEISRIRQPIESLFNSIQDKTGIQNASKVRSTAGTIVHIFGKLAASLFIILLNF